MLLFFSSHIAAAVVILRVVPSILKYLVGIETHDFWGVAIAITMIVIALNNLLVSSLIAFRILGMTHGVMAHLESKPKKMYSTIIAATYVLESGLIYSVLLSILSIMVIKLSWPRPKLHNYPAFFILTNVINIFLHAWPSVVGIMSTIIIVCIALSVSTNKAETILASDFSIFWSVDDSLQTIAMIPNTAPRLENMPNNVVLTL
ncbi:hypothetical protein Moror_7860 [Moniliophthora roreri MCA 2997]|uniref:Uncharacterized protein n=1 Tax=Moniliophthora roreri (strain MCA 2997) TaxID=1381753 RepID=V2X8K5_MONRO|nr:hypothetical protein Moror_7860 [Moniliophthora roreri MCA 2997]